MSRVPENAGGTPRRLTKRDVERLVDAYDLDPLAALEAALAVLEAPESLRTSLGAMSTSQHDALLKDLIEWRGLEPPGPPGINR